MKFIIAQSTVRTGNEQCAQLNTIIYSALGNDAPAQAYDDVILTNEFVNFNITKEADDYVFELNDECVLKYMRLYIKVAQTIAPFVKPIIGLITMLKTEITEIEAFIGQRK